MAVVTRNGTSAFGRCDRCPGVAIEWSQEAAHRASNVVHLLDIPVSYLKRNG